MNLTRTINCGIIDENNDMVIFVNKWSVNVMSIIKITDTKKLALPKGSVSSNTLSEFKTALNSYISKINIAVSHNENEEHIKNIINDFLRMSFYSDSRFSINTDGNIDSTIKENGNLLAIIEAKAPQNKAEMISEQNINKKALWEAVYYYLEKPLMFQTLKQWYQPRQKCAV